MLSSSTPVVADRSVNGSIKSEQNRVLNQRTGMTAFSLSDCFFATSYSPKKRADTSANANHMTACLQKSELVTQTYTKDLLELNAGAADLSVAGGIGNVSLDVIVILQC